GGKTALAATATIATAQGGGRVLYAALEMPRTDLAWRFAAGFCRVPVSVDHINTGTINKREADDLQRASREVSALPILVEDRDLTVNALCAL
ncbi:DnaB helicase C-terminal domain-containing protein, partial [Erwinia amylovora]|uniref:DnaB helicase C-terminal domain-containing protein n=1 Tax=Erwinia amylovora TaxID=552 RepID=UPI0020BEC588